MVRQVWTLALRIEKHYEVFVHVTVYRSRATDTEEAKRRNTDKKNMGILKKLPTICFTHTVKKLICSREHCLGIDGEFNLKLYCSSDSA